ncbi:MarP family serine protease [Corynebacterium bovis]|uniref:MarP family serine protease n=1 Tax=Corynebacterium bovis TaxID=36808 RepID=UPI003138D8F4
MTGSTMVDVALAVVALLAMVSGWRQGGFSAVLSFLGVLGGGYLGVRLVPTVMDRLSSEQGQFIGAVVTVTLGVILGYALGTVIGGMLRDRIRTRTALRTDSAVGAVVQVLTTVIVIWLIAVPLVGRGNGPVIRAVQGSRILGTVTKVAPDSLAQLPSRFTTLFSDSGFPAVTNPFDQVPVRTVDAPDAALAGAPSVARDRDSVVRVVGQAQQCRRLLQGSGFVVDRNTVMTNAHVVAGTDTVKINTVDGPVDTTVVYYNPVDDIALLRASDLHLEPLSWASDGADSGDDAIVMGYPMGGPFTATPARVRDRYTISGPDIYASTRVEREAYTVRGHVVQGNSGGPLVDAQGRVLGLVFGAEVNDPDTGYALTKDEIMSTVGDVSRYRDPVDTQGCVLN